MSLSFLTAAATRAAATAPATAPQAAMGEAVVAPRPLETRDACCAKYRRIFELRAPSRHAHAHARTALFSLFALSLCLRASPPRLSLCICSAAPLLLSPLPFERQGFGAKMPNAAIGLISLSKRILCETLLEVFKVPREDRLFAKCK